MLHLPVKGKRVTLFLTVLGRYEQFQSEVLFTQGEHKSEPMITPQPISLHTVKFCSKVFSCY